MRLLYLALPLLGSLAIAQSLVENNCQCPQVKCPASDTVAGCRCINIAERNCKLRCPKYTITKFRQCYQPIQSTTDTLSLPTPSLPILGFPTPALPVPAPPSTSVLPDKPRIPGCECEEMMCIQSFPASCHCAYGIAKTCWEKCGGKSPGINTCPAENSFGGGPFDGPVKRAAAPEPQVAPKKAIVPIPFEVPVKIPAAVSAAIAPLASGKASIKPCKCEERMCVMSYPAGCICANANKHACWKKCGGVKPLFQNCTSPVKPSPVKPSPKPAPDNKVQICGGGRANTNFCPSGYTCIDDPYKPGCGLACDQTGICVKEQLCGGFAGFKCPAAGQVCVDDPRDDCSPETGGADCGGLCVWPPALRAA